jgi:hypothetical protein
MFQLHRCSPALTFTPVRAALSALTFAALMGIVAPASAQDARPNRIAIEYVPPTEPRQQGVYTTVKERRALEMMQEIFGPFRLPNELTLKTKTCGMSNAWYQRPTLTICYEYLEDIRNSLPKEPPPAGMTESDLVMGQFLYVVAHEMGHAMFDQLNVPLFGRGEDAADGFATYMMLRLGKKEARRLIGGAAYSYKDYIKNPQVTVRTSAFSDVHGAPMQRFYNLLCLAYGSDRETYADLVDAGYLPKERARSCGMEYGELNFAFQQLIVPHLDRELAKAVLEKDWLPTTSGSAAPDTRATDMQKN